MEKILRKSLLQWYSLNARKLPWRKTKDPYKIWVSEIMLQQTQVDTVIPYYEKWLKRFPSIRALAKADLEDVLKYWAGLGYYRRARMLHGAAQTIVKEYKGKIPSSAEALQKIPGIGRYTAGAISSIAFDKKAPIVDGNVIRILTRIFAIKSDIGDAKTVKKLWKKAEEVLPNKNVGDFNQAMMELGATVCLPENPGCLICPVSAICKANAQGKQTAYPVRSDREKGEKIKTAALIVRKKEKVLICKQPLSNRWGGLWMFPHWENKKAMEKEIGLEGKALKKKMTVRHGFTKYRIDLEVFEPTEKLSYPKNQESKWVAIKELKKHPFPSPHQKIVKSLCQR